MTADATTDADDAVLPAGMTPDWMDDETWAAVCAATAAEGEPPDLGEQPEPPDLDGEAQPGPDEDPHVPDVHDGPATGFVARSGTRSSASPPR
ncbi:MAG: hypothetical protein JO132_01005 [Streptosporangiaceae bacterium]|nr:hypothetical protein [Streptosporangiaceae bacterium]